MGDRWDRERWRTAAERLLATDMGVDEWCALNHVSSSALYRRLAWFRDNEPEVLGGWEAAHAGDGERRWLEAVRAAARGAALPSAPHAPGFVEVGLPAPLPGDRRHGGAAPITVEVRVMVVSVPPGTSRGDVLAVLSAAVSA